MNRYVSKKSARRLGAELPASPARLVKTADNRERGFYLLDSLCPTRSVNVEVLTDEQIDELAEREQQERLRRAVAEAKRREEHERWCAEALVREAEHKRQVTLRRKQTIAERRTQTDPGCPYRSLNAAYADGWIKRTDGSIMEGRKCC